MNQDLEILKYLAKKDKQIEKYYKNLIYQLSKVSLSISKINDGAFFSFDDYPEIKKKVDAVLDSYSKEQQMMILDGMRTSMKLSFVANAVVLSQFTRYSDKALRDMRESAAEAFISSRMKPKQGLSLSQKVWNYTQQAKSEFEAGMSEVLEEGIKAGTSAEELGRKLRDKLQYPDMVYKRYHVKKLTATGKKDVIEWRRKVVDSEGKVRYIKEDLEKVGQGVYRSSRKNALRLTATEINMAYRYADNVRWQSEPFVIGFRIQLSANHTLNGEPFHDMCDDLIGDYPKWFRWAGWHPRCRCIATSILVDREEMKKIAKLSDEEYKRYKSPNLITKMPANYDAYVEDNRDRIMRAMDRGTLPYWVKDNYRDGDIDKGFYWTGKRIKTEEHKAAIQAAWDARKQKNAIQLAAQKRHANRDAKAIQEAWDKRKRRNAVLAAAEKRHASRDAVAIQKAWDERKARYAKLKKIATNVWSVSLDYPWVDSTNLQFLIHRKKYHLLEDEYRKVAKNISMVKAQQTMLSTLIPNVKTWQHQFSYDELKAAYDSVEKAIAKIEKEPLNHFKYGSILEQKKALYEKELKYVIDPTYLKPHTLYSTWQVAESAYMKQLGKVENQIAKTVFQKDYDDMLLWLSNHPKATSVASKVKVLHKLLNDDNLNLAEIGLQMKDIKSHILTIDNAAAKRAIKKGGKALGLSETEINELLKAFNKNTVKEVDDLLRPVTEAVWATLSDEERLVLTKYTQTYSYLNEPLRGLTYSGARSKSEYTNDLPILTSALNKFDVPKSMVVRRGTYDYNIPEINKQLSDVVVGDEFTDGGFLSTACHRSKGFTRPYNLVIVIPKGMKGAYAEPFSHYTDYHKFDFESNDLWNGVSNEPIGGEFEWIGQRGGRFKVLEKKGNTIYLLLTGQLK